MKSWIKAVSTALALSAIAVGCASRSADEDVFLPPPEAPLRLDRTAPYAPPAPGSSANPGARAPAPAPGPTAVAYRLRVGDAVIVSVRTPVEQQYELIIDEYGMIKLPMIPDIRAAGMTGSDLERAIKSSYINNKIYRDITVNVIVPQRSYFVRGEVRSPGRYPIIGGVTLLQALAAAGGYTEFADPRRIQISRQGGQISANARDIERNQAEDIAIETGDVIVVPRTWY